MRDYDELLKAGNAAQLEKLKENEHKSGFNDINIDYAFKRLTEEVEELRKELFDKTGNGTYHIFNTRSEAADIANFAHMIILACDKENDKAF